MLENDEDSGGVLQQAFFLPREESEIEHDNQLTLEMVRHQDRNTSLRGRCCDHDGRSQSSGREVSILSPPDNETFR